MTEAPKKVVIDKHGEILTIPEKPSPDELCDFAMDVEVHVLRPLLRLSLAKLFNRVGPLSPEEDKALTIRFFRALGFTEEFIQNSVEWKTP